MKKLALTSLLAMFAVSGAHAANIIDGNPLYMPKAGHFYSVTSVDSHSENIDSWGLNEEFGYGVTDRLTINVETGISEDEGFDGMGWDDASVAGTFRLIEEGGWKADLLGGYGVGPIWRDHLPHVPFLDKDATMYAWLVGARAGYVAGDWTLAGHVMFSYMNTESFNWGDDGMHMWIAGLDGQYLIDEDWNLVAGVEYTGLSDDGAHNAGTWTGSFGVNYNINPSAFVGAYIDATMRHATGDWKVDDGFGFGVKFGVDF